MSFEVEGSGSLQRHQRRQRPHPPAIQTTRLVTFQLALIKSTMLSVLMNLVTNRYVVVGTLLFHSCEYADHPEHLQVSVLQENLRERSSRAPFLSRPESESGYTWMKPPKDPNKLSEEMVRCMVNIYSNLADSGDEQRQPHSGLLSPSSHFGNLTSSSLSSLSESSLLSFARSPLVDLRKQEDVMGCDASPDPYKARGKLPWADIGPYSNFLEVPWLSVGKKELEYAAHALCTYR